MFEIPENASLEEAILMTVGAASVCWSEVPKGVFDSDYALKIAKILLEHVVKKSDPFWQW